jgi:hypothetical protein
MEAVGMEMLGRELNCVNVTFQESSSDSSLKKKIQP